MMNEEVGYMDRLGACFDRCSPEFGVEIVQGGNHASMRIKLSRFILSFYFSFILVLV